LDVGKIITREDLEDTLLSLIAGEIGEGGGVGEEKQMVPEGWLGGL